jgi:aminoglycoside/choline kinase family phosphotransferase
MTATSREQLIEHWLAARLGKAYLDRTPASDDASFRRYFRIRTEGGTLVLMDAPPSHEDCGPFLAVNALLRGAGLTAPRVHASDVALGLVLLDDLGDTCMLDRLPEDREALYETALRALVTMQARIDPSSLKPYDAGRLRAELALFPDWLLLKHLGLDLAPPARAVLAETFDALVSACLEQPQVFVHRDYHSRNLMARSEHDLAIIDHQDALRGPVAYDLVSLVRDVYVRWPPAVVRGWIGRYRALALSAGVPCGDSAETFERWVDLTGAQRHLKIAGIFARLFHRDGKSRYLADIVLTLDYLAEACATQPELERLGSLLEELALRKRVLAANARVVEQAAAARAGAP